jgi:hypothetical protein
MDDLLGVIAAWGVCPEDTSTTPTAPRAAIAVISRLGTVVARLGTVIARLGTVVAISIAERITRGFKECRSTEPYGSVSCCCCSSFTF